MYINVSLCQNDKGEDILMPEEKRNRLSLDVTPQLRRRLRLAAARRDLTLRQYVLDAIEERLGAELEGPGEPLLALTAKSDPVLAELWDNAADAQYDRFRSR
jgi:uncharacterized protein (DUF1778 family)